MVLLHPFYKLEGPIDQAYLRTYLPTILYSQGTHLPGLPRWVGWSAVTVPTCNARWRLPGAGGWHAPAIEAGRGTSATSTGSHPGGEERGGMCQVPTYDLTESSVRACSGVHRWPH